MKKIIFSYFLCHLAFDVNAIPPIPDKPEFQQFAVGPGNELIARMAQGGVFRSADGGRHWIKTLQDDSHLLIIQGGDLLSIKIRGKVYRSKDFGATWTYDGVTADVPWARTILGSTSQTSVDEDGAYYVCTGKSLVITSDGGKNWRDPGPVDGCFAIAANRKIIYIVGPNGISKSKDRGVNWSPVSKFDKTAKPLVLHDDITYLRIDHLGTLYAMTSRGELYGSYDEGVNWRRQTFGLTDTLNLNIEAVLLDAIYISSGPSQQKILYRSVSGKTATDLNFNNYPWTDIRSGSDGAIYIATPDILYKSTNEGKTWLPLSRHGITW